MGAAEDIRAKHLARLRRMREEIDEMIAEVDSPAPARAANAPPGPLVWMTQEEYARHRRVGMTKLREYIRAGLPVHREGRVVRIKVAEADAWDPDNAAADQARVDAARGR